MTAKDSANEVLEDIAAAGVTAVHRFANFVLDECKLTHAEADLQKFGNFEIGAVPLYASTSDPGSSGRLANAEVASTQRRRLFISNTDKINKKRGRPNDPRTNKPAKVAKWAVSEASASRAAGNKPIRVPKSNDVLDNGRRDVY